MSKILMSVLLVAGSVFAYGGFFVPEAQAGYCTVNLGDCRGTGDCTVNVGYCDSGGWCTLNVGYCNSGCTITIIRCDAGKGGLIDVLS